MGLVQLYIAASLDGFIADRDGGVEWLEEFQGGDDHGYREFYSRVGAVVMGSKTYEQVAEFGTWPYGDIPAWIYTTRELPVHEGATVRFTSAPPAEVVAEIEREVEGNVWLVGGGAVVRQFIDAGMLDELLLFVVPRLLGEGVPLFGGTGFHRAEFVAAQPHPSGIVELRYRFDRSSGGA